MILTATPASGMRFVRWGGGCIGNLECTPTLAPSTNVTALFAPRTYQLAIGVLGRGSVVTSAASVRCQSRCRLPVTSYQSVSLRAAAAAGWRLQRWTGACHGTQATCRLPMTSNTSATALFAKKKTKKA
jgi:hypothetical protein